jgi:glycosyltransferase involved in cell wall biosynthesis
MRSGTVISSVPVVANRPMFSVMIPTYNCARLLEETLSSVLDQQMSPELMEIIVVDDCSNDKPEEVVDRLGAGRVSFCRHNENMGATATFNDCILRSSGHLVHILHGDDFVLPGFYSTTSPLDSRTRVCSPRELSSSTGTAT